MNSLKEEHKSTKILIIRVPKEKDGTGKVFKDITAEDFPNLAQNIQLQS